LDREQSPLYDGLRLDEQPGLVPLGRDPESGLYEFGHTRSGRLPIRGQKGSLAIGPGTGLVFVLIPGGRFFMGAQATDPLAPGYDPEASEWEAPVREVSVGPFFLSKFELTAAQWQRLRGEKPPAEGAQLPVMRVSSDECENVLTEVGLVLPSSAQWEYAARGMTQSPWWTGTTEATLEGAENLRDRSTEGRLENPDGNAPWDDGYPRHAPVGSFRANPFGLHDVHGNAFEWCADRPEPGLRTLRGGGSFVIPRYARVSIEWSRETEFRGGHLGLRPACAILAEVR
jgi:formylglycine-generating enzyme required for sulfatase activity